MRIQNAAAFCAGVPTDLRCQPYGVSIRGCALTARGQRVARISLPRLPLAGLSKWHFTAQAVSASQSSAGEDSDFIDFQHARYSVFPIYLASLRAEVVVLDAAVASTFTTTNVMSSRWDWPFAKADNSTKMSLMTPSVVNPLQVRSSLSRPSEHVQTGKRRRRNSTAPLEF